MKYEIHLTLDSHAEIEGWKSSKIDGDPLLGKGVKHYLTTYASLESLAHGKILRALAELDKMTEVKFLRAKIELIIYDEVFQ